MEPLKYFSILLEFVFNFTSKNLEKIRIWGIYTTSSATHWLHRLGLEKVNLQTSSLPITPEHRSYPALGGYHVQRALQFTGPNLHRLLGSHNNPEFYFPHSTDVEIDVQGVYTI